MMTPRTSRRHRRALAAGAAALIATLVLALHASAAPQTAGDFDDDGIDDVAIGIEGDKVGTQGAAGAVQVVFGTNNGLRFGNDAIINQAGTSDDAAAGDRFGRVVAVGDFDGDGFADLAVGVPLEDLGNDTNAGIVHVFYGSAGGPDPTDDQVWTENIGGLGSSPADAEFFGASLTVGDFDNDGFDDLAIGAPNETLSDVQQHAGAVFVLYGSAGGLTNSGAQLWTQNAGVVLDVAEPNDHFGAALASGDFDNDGFDDLAIGVPDESINTIQRAGGVNVLFGTGGGLSSANNQFFSQNTTNIDDVSEVGDNFGQALAAGDFNGDGRDDLAIGAPNENVGTEIAAGSVNVLLGSLNGLAAAGDKFFNQATPGILEAAEAGDLLGFALAAGDFNNDGFADLAMGVPHESVGAISGAGSVNVVYGSATGLQTAGNQLWRQAGPLKDDSEQGDAFGEALGVGDFNGDSFDDLLVGVPLEDIGANTDAGAVQIIYGSSIGLTDSDNQFISQNTQNAEGVARSGDRFGGQMLDLF